MKLRLYEENVPQARNLVRQKLAERPVEVPSAQMNAAVTPDELALRNRLSEETGWSHRETQVLALKVLEALLAEEALNAAATNSA